MGRPRYFLLRGDLDQRRWLPQQAWSTRRICVIVIQIVILAVLLGYIAAVLAQESGSRFEVGGNSDVRVDQSRSLTCNVVKGPVPPSFVWVKDGNVLPSQRKKHLYLSSVTKKDVGYYQCGAPDSSSYGRRFQLRVWAPGDPIPRPDTHPKGVSVLGRPFSLHCLFPEGFVKSENTVYTWYKDSVEVTGQNGEILLFDSLKEGDEGQYTCSAEEGPPQTTSPQSLPFDVRPLVPPQVRIKPPGPVIKGVRGETLTLTCEVTRAFPDVPVDGYSWSYLPCCKDPGRPLKEKARTLTLGPLTLDDGGQYVCQARNDQGKYSNLNLTGNASVTVDVVFPISNTTEAEVSASFHFSLPDWTPMVVVHPGGHDVISVGQDCSYNVSSAFQSRCLQPQCDSIRHRLSFTLTNVTEEDEGEYVCVEEGPQREPVPNCGMSLRLRKLKLDESPSAHFALTVFAFLLVLLCGFLPGIVLGSWQHTNVQDVFKRIRKTAGAAKKLISWIYSAKQRQVLHTRLPFENYYKNGEVYILPKLVPPKEEILPDTVASTEQVPSSPLLQQPQNTQKQKAEFLVKNLLRSALTRLKSTNDLPSFLLHNARLSNQRDVIVVLNKTLGVVVTVVSKATGLWDQQEAKEEARHLMEAKETIRQKLQGIVTSDTIQAFLSLPGMTQDEAEELWSNLRILLSDPDIKALGGQEQEDPGQWVQNLMNRSSGNLWKSTNQEGEPSDSVYKKVAHSFLTLASHDCPEQSPDDIETVEPLLLTPAQVEVRDSMARHLHIWGPPGSGKTILLVHRARQWLAEGKAVILAVGREFYDIQLAHIERIVQLQETDERVRICRTNHEIDRAMKDLRGKYPQAEKCVIVDMLKEEELLKKLLPDVKSGNINSVWSTARENFHPTTTDVSEEMRMIGWESIHLPDCIRCTDNTVELLNLLGHGVFPPIPSCSVSRDQDIPAWRVVDHCLHPDHVNTKTKCVHCKEEMSSLLPFTKQGLWKSWVALHTGDPNIYVDTQPVEEAAKFFGVPVPYNKDTYLRHETTLATSASRQDKSTIDFASFRAQVMDGLDKEGNPALHVIRVEDFEGMEREGVIVVHWDFRDTDPDCQSQGERATRLEEHRHQWIQAASRSTGQVLLLLLSPSPARSLLGLPEVDIL